MAPFFLFRLNELCFSDPVKYRRSVKDVRESKSTIGSSQTSGISVILHHADAGSREVEQHLRSSIAVDRERRGHGQRATSGRVARRDEVDKVTLHVRGERVAVGGPVVEGVLLVERVPARRHAPHVGVLAARQAPRRARHGGVGVGGGVAPERAGVGCGRVERGGEEGERGGRGGG